ncbi:acetyltransferase [Bacillus mycoides]|uniref:acetyltransferase n=1 Tax=Bacillus mycoides TaxID=1405 RepID=UPI003A8006BA
MIPVKIKSNASGRVISGTYTPKQLVDFLGEEELVEDLTKCDCQSIGETNVVECNCESEWEDYELFLDYE